ncbi:MAG: TraB/GumN family protein [Rhodanobacter sp.]
MDGRPRDARPADRAIGTTAHDSVKTHNGLWVIRRADTTIYLFGTVHLLPNDTDWRYPALDQDSVQAQLRKLGIEATRE